MFYAFCVLCFVFYVFCVSLFQRFRPFLPHAHEVKFRVKQLVHVLLSFQFMNVEQLTEIELDIFNMNGKTNLSLNSTLSLNSSQLHMSREE